MRAIKIEAEVEQDHSMHLHLPEDVAAGPVEVLVLVPDGPHGSAGRTLVENLDRLPIDPAQIRSKEALDTYLAQERDSWE